MRSEEELFTIMTKTYLAVPREEARKLIEAQIAKGKEMFRTKIWSRVEFETLENAYDRWTDYNVQLCRELFTDDSIANEVHWHKAQLLEDRTLKEDVKHLQARIRDQLNKLISVNERIGIIAIKQPNATAHAETKNVHEKSVKELIKSNRHWIFEGIGTQTIQWIGSGLLILILFVGGYFWTKKPSDTLQSNPSPTPNSVPAPTATPTHTVIVSPTPTASVTPNTSEDEATHNPNKIVSSVDPTIWPFLIGTWQQQRRDEETQEFKTVKLSVRFFSEGGLLKCSLTFTSDDPRLKEKMCTKLIVDGRRILYSFGGSDYTGTMDLRKTFMQGKIISYGDTADRGEWSLYKLR